MKNDDFTNVDFETQSLIEGFLSEMISNEASPLTIDNYRDFLYKFFAKVKKRVCEINYDDINKWRLEYKAKFKETRHL